ncbi:MAG: glutathione S-transferase family protein [Gammaproteobacteria bacterium]|nr:glutathione S-transferase family protein [Gammaproteobacteria bacterium]
MSAPVLRIFSYLPNPRVWKSLIAGELCGVEVEVIGDKPSQLGTWLWDYDARELRKDERGDDSPLARVSRRGFSGTLFKTDAFLQAHPFGTVPAAFAPGGAVGIFESNSILRAVARAGQHNLALYGRDDYEASRIDSFLDANLVFAREAQVYLLAMDNPVAAVHKRMTAAYEFYLAGLESALAQSAYLAGDALTIADISFVCDFAQFLREGHYSEALSSAGLSLISEDGPTEYRRAFEHMLRLSETPAFAGHMGTYLDWYRRRS